MTILNENIEQFISKYEEFKKTEKENIFLLKGEFNRDVSINDKEKLLLIFDLEIIVLKNYPNNMPLVREVNDKIPKNFHSLDEKYFCLAAPYKIYSHIKQDASLVAFFEKFVVPYLYSYQYNKKYGYMPFGELKHGTEGILDVYKDIFDTDSVEIISNLLKQAMNIYRGHHLCECGSHKRLRNCHGMKIIEIKKSLPLTQLEYEINKIDIYKKNIKI